MYVPPSKLVATLTLGGLLIGYEFLWNNDKKTIHQNIFIKVKIV